ncbi:hypothetical protein LZ30DRAFT_33530 [Colletotrichum cereale]|nr:hypothetical protein LZ30DRAFT_33530 [Colletotrichum cereale]
MRVMTSNVAWADMSIGALVSGFWQPARVRINPRAGGSPWSSPVREHGVATQPGLFWTLSLFLVPISVRAYQVSEWDIGDLKNKIPFHTRNKRLVACGGGRIPARREKVFNKPHPQRAISTPLLVQCRQGSAARNPQGRRRLLIRGQQAAWLLVLSGPPGMVTALTEVWLSLSLSRCSLSLLSNRLDSAVLVLYMALSLATSRGFVVPFVAHRRCNHSSHHGGLDV